MNLPSTGLQVARGHIALSADEASTLERYEATIAGGLAQFVAVGDALIVIRDARLYRAKYNTFEAYCRDRWGFTSRRARGLISAAEVVGNLTESGTDGSTLPENERQAREMSPLTPEEQRIVWDVVTKTAPAGQITAAHVKSVVQVLKEVGYTGAVDGGEGDDIPISEATPDHLKAAITEQTYERLRRQETYIASGRQKRLENNYQTPASVLDALLPYIPASSRVIWLPLAKDGLLAKVLRAAGYVSLEAPALSDEADLVAAEPEGWDIVIAHPAASQSIVWLENAYGFGKPFALAMPIGVLASRHSHPLFAENGVEVVFLTGTYEQGTTKPLAWFTWGLQLGASIVFAGAAIPVHEGEAP